MTRPTSTDPNDYEILIRRRGEAEYASYCPQLARMVRGTEHVEVEDAMKAIVLQYIAEIGNGSIDSSKPS
ncbi:MAG: hypothetical protein HQ472_07830 [Ignavibacteria bacterium]|nr:hypothetical protein [Ignavibacteria bacterium]